jgi:hypothetical protein
MSITLKQFNEELITPEDDALLYDHLIGESGIFEGCVVTHLGANQLQITAGRGIIKGRIFVVAQQTILATVSDSGTKLGRLIVEVDIENAVTPIAFVTQMAASLPALTQEDINRDGAVYQLPLSTYSITETTISNLVSVATALAAIKPHNHVVTASRAIVSDGSGVPVAAAVTAAELGYLAGVTGNIQDQLNDKVEQTDIDAKFVYAAEEPAYVAGRIWLKPVS